MKNTFLCDRKGTMVRGTNRRLKRGEQKNK